MSENKKIQEDWEQRSFISSLQNSMLQISDFLNSFDLTMRSKLGEMNERLVSLERTIEFVEEAVKHSNTKTITSDD